MRWKSKRGGLTAALGALAGLALALPALAAPTPVLASGDGEAALETLSPGKRVYEAVDRGASRDVVGQAILDALGAASRPCPRLMDYQVQRPTSGLRRIKIKCREQRLYAMAIAENGTVSVTGGDGTVSPMKLSDGPIITMLGVDLQEYLAQSAAGAQGRAVDGAESAPFVQPADEQRAPSRFLTFASAALALFVLLSALGVIFYDRAKANLLAPLRNLPSSAKDELIAESRELYPNIWQHPGGAFIARGKRGKRRLFSSLAGAYLYRDFGLKVGQIR